MLQKLEMPDGGVDGVCCISVLEHTDNYGEIVREFARVLRTGGLLVLTFDLSLDGKFELRKEVAADLLANVAEYFDLGGVPVEQELDRMGDRNQILSTDHVKRTEPDLLPWRFPMAKAVHDLVKGHGWTGGFRSKSVFCLYAAIKVDRTSAILDFESWILDFDIQSAIQIQNPKFHDRFLSSFARPLCLAIPRRPFQRTMIPRSRWHIWAILMSAIAAIYLLMFNPYWVPGGDSELYIAGGRSWATGCGHTFNGQFVSISPPGWPLVMAAAMKISPTFGFLKLITIACMTFTMGFWYWFLLRFTTPKNSAHAHAALLRSSRTFIRCHSGCTAMRLLPVTTAAMVVASRSTKASRMSAGGSRCWRFCVCGPMRALGRRTAMDRYRRRFARRAGSAKTLANDANGEMKSPNSAPGNGRPSRFRLRSSRGTFAMLRHELATHAAAGGRCKGRRRHLRRIQQAAEAKTVDIFNGKQSAKLTFTQEMFKRVRESGKWFSWLLWPEFRFLGGTSVKGMLSSLDAVIGWLLIAALCTVAWRNLRQRQWLWLAPLVYCAFLCLNWPNPNARYLVPVLPIILWGIIQGIRMAFANPAKMQWGTRLIATGSGFRCGGQFGPAGRGCLGRALA